MAKQSCLGDYLAVDDNGGTAQTAAAQDSAAPGKQKIKKKKKNGKKKTRYECRYRDGCGKKKDYCDDNGDCCGGYRCDNKKNRCKKK